MQWLQRLHRLEHDNLAVYIDPLIPDWFVPSTQTDLLLQAARTGASFAEIPAEYAKNCNQPPDQARRDLERLRKILDRSDPAPYRGRAHYLNPGALKEIWFHLTDNCNLSCRHCLFSASPAKKDAIAFDSLLSSIDQAAQLGCQLFYFTGGEPFVYPDFCSILTHLFEKYPAAHAVVLTNGLLLKKHLPSLNALDSSRLHLQVSLDGLEQEHDSLRGKGSYNKLEKNLAAATEAGLAVTLSVAVNAANVQQLPEIARKADKMGATGLHLMYHFIRGKGTDEQFVEPSVLFSTIWKTAEVCREIGLEIDNLETIKAQVFTVPGTRFDLTNAGWESMAVGPDGNIYPSPALVRVNELVCGSVNSGLNQVFAHSEVLQKLRAASLADSKNWHKSPLSFITGGGDPDHSWVHSATFAENDPYVELYEQLVLYLIVEQAKQYPDQGLFRLRMGDVRHDCPGADNGSDGSVALTHCNCVVSLANPDGHSSVREFYGSAAREANKEITNPFAPDGILTSFIPEESTVKSYGCGSPVQDAAPWEGETVVDLGSGSGVECFLAAADVGATGKVYGIDMTDDMLNLARESQQEVVKKLGYDNLEFRKGFLEDIPLPDNTADVVISNCVINLSPDKRRTYLEILRILKPGGRLVVSDVITDEPVSPFIKNSDSYRGQCLGGAMQQNDLITMLEDCGFTSLYLHKRAPYRQVADNRFFSLTYEARKKENPALQQLAVVYRGPLPFLQTDTDIRLERGIISFLPAAEAERLGKLIFVLDAQGAVTNIEQESCCCATPPQTKQVVQVQETPQVIPLHRHKSGCMVCGAKLIYTNESTNKQCHYCGSVDKTTGQCTKGHFICDACHQQEGGKIIRQICLNTKETDLLALLTTLRSHPAMPMHGPEHHAMMPGIILAVYRNCGGNIDADIISSGIDRGSKVPGGACGFWGSCGAAIGAGIAAALILDATPLTPNPRQQAQAFTARILSSIAEVTGGRCCQRETWLALTHTARLSKDFLGLEMQAGATLHCDQYMKNQECIRKQCPLWSLRARTLPKSIFQEAG
jgi:MoaA/NifB/PqqE/SkfB family radical SAM enzyme/SAM-dependent methyltransferase